MMGSKRLALVGIIAALLLVLSGLCVNGPLDLYTPSALIAPLMLLFALSGLILLGTGALWLGSSFGRWRQGRTWAPLFAGLLGVAVSLALLALVQFNVQLYGFWVIFAVVLFLGSSAALAALVVARLWAKLKPPTGQDAHETRTA